MQASLPHFHRQQLAQALAPLAPSVLVWQAYAPFLAQGGSLVAALRDVSIQKFFRSVELPTVPDPAERLAISRLAVDSGWEVMVWASDAQADEHLNLAALDLGERKRSQQRFQELVRAARECGARRLGFCSPPDCAAPFRTEAMRLLAEELVVLADAGANAGVSIVFEALDRSAHKKGLLGTSSELNELAGRVRAASPGFGVVWDSAHAALNGEDLLSSFRAVHRHVVAAHFSDAILDPANGGFGDWHMRVGEGDAMKAPVVRELLLALLECSRSRQVPLTLAIEEFNREPDTPGAAFLERAWNYVGDCL